MSAKILLYVLTLSLLLVSCGGNEHGQELSKLAVDPIGNLIPVVKQTSLNGKYFTFSGDWKIDGVLDSNGISAVKSLKDGLQILVDSGRIRLNEKAENTIRFIVNPGAVTIDQVIDTNRASLQEQAYQLKLGPKEISITANTPQGLYYGVQTFLQLLHSQTGLLALPEGEIMDWPDLALRMIYWDDAHHLEKFDALKRIILQASQYKINAFAIKLEGHFQFSSAPAIVEPYALSPAQYQELTDFARAHFVELVPYLDAPAHLSFILKHPEYKDIRLYPNNNYELCVTDPKAIELTKNMFGDLLNANSGGKWVMLSTDEPYYVGKAPREAKAAKEAGSNGKLLAGFIKTIADDLSAKGRTPIFWGEFPLVAEDIPWLPSYLINGEYNNLASAFSAQGIRQMVYTSTQGEEPIFPNYYLLNEQDTSKGIGRVPGMLRDLRSAVADKKSSLAGIIVAGWADAGLHPETFWLGYITGTAMGWNLGASNAGDLSKRFFISFYGPGQSGMDSVYRLLSTQAELYDSSWEWKRSDWRNPILGNSEGIFLKPEKAFDQSIPMLPMINPEDLSPNEVWDTMYRVKFMNRTISEYLSDNEKLITLLQQNWGKTRQDYNLDVLISVADLCRQNLDLLLNFSKINGLLEGASIHAADQQSKEAVAMIDEALSTAIDVKKQRDSVLTEISKTWYKEWEPLVKEANGRKFLFELDDIKDHRPGRTIDLNYLIYRELNYPQGRWFDQILANRNIYAKNHGLATKSLNIDWEKR